MRGAAVALGVLLVLWLISRIRVGGIAEYSAGGVLAYLRIGPFRVELFPGKPAAEQADRPPKEKKKKKKEPARPEEPVPLTEKAGGALRLFRELLPIALDAAGKIFGRVRIDELVLHLTWASPDPAAAAVGYGAGQAALGVLWPLLDSAFDIRKRDIGVAVDFQSSEPVVYVRGSLSFTLGQLLSLGLASGFRALMAFRRARSKGRRRAEKKAETAAGAAVTPDTQTNTGTNGKEGSLS